MFFFFMPHIPLHRRLLKELDDADHSFKRAHLSKYLQDVSIEPFVVPMTSDSNSGESNAGNSNDSDISSISSLSSLSSISSLGSDDESTIQPTPSLSFSDIQEMYFLMTQAQIDRLRQEVLTSRVLRKNPAITKLSQIHLLEHWRCGNLDQYRRRVRVDPNIFDGIADKICGHQIFHNNSNVPQAPIEVQLAIFLFRAGHYGNAASPEAIRHWAGMSPGMVANCTNRVMLALLSLHDESVHLPTAEEKESAKAWVAAQVCPEWRDGHLMVDGTKFSLFQRPGLHGNAWFDKNRSYSLDCQVCITFIYAITF